MWYVALAVGGTYISSSILFTKFPNLLPGFIKNRHGWKNEKKFPTNVHISHRGGAGEYYENTLKAFKGSSDLGTQMLELDVHITKDGQVVVSHDQNLLRVTGENIKIKDTNFENLPKLKTEVPIDFLFQKAFSSEDRTDEHISIPKLETVFQTFPRLGVNIDIKTYDEELIKEVNKLVQKYDRENLTVWGNFSAKTTEKCYLTNPNIGLLFSIKQVFLLLIYFYTGLLPYVTFKETHLEIPMPLTAYKKFGPEITTKQKFLAHVSNFLLMRPWLFEHLQKRGIQTYVWVLNTEEDIDTAFKCGITGVMTDYPSLLRDYLQKHPQYVTKKMQ